MLFFRKTQASQALTKFIERIIYIYNTKYIPHETKIYGESNAINLVSYMLITFFIRLAKFYKT